MARETLDRKIQHLFDEILYLDSMVEKATLDSIAALKNQDLALARSVYFGDSILNAKRFELEKDCMITIATQQPIMAGDLRLLASILEIIGELERMGDYAKGIAKICIIMGHQPPVKPLIDIPKMAEIVTVMLHRAVGAFVSMNIEEAKEIPKDDDKVDHLYNLIYHELVDLMIKDPTIIDRANYLMWVSHNLERLADRVTNICERTIYVVTGEMRELSASDDEFELSEN